MRIHEPAKEGKSGTGNTELKPTEAVRRILEAAGAEVVDKEAFWLGTTGSVLLNIRKSTVSFLEFPTAVEACVTFFRQGKPADWQVDQLKQALVFFGRGQSGGGG